MRHDFQRDIDVVQRIAAIPTILDVVCRATGMGFAAVARVTEERWIACQVLDNIHFGLPPGGELKVETTLCHDVRQLRGVIAIDNVAQDPTYRTHHTPSIYGLQSYISVPIILPDGSFFGTLCAIDPKPAKLNNPQILGTFKLFAELIAHHLDADQRLDHAQARLFDERAASELREQFIAVLGHDLRNPLAAIDSGMHLLMREPQTDKAKNILSLMRRSIVRMSGLIDNVLDFARGRLGGGFALDKTAGDLSPSLEHVIAELQTGHPEIRIEASLDLPDAIIVDHQRIAQMFSNLLANATTHGSGEHPVQVEARITDSRLHLAVSNAGTPISREKIERLFEPFSRGGGGPHSEGLGLGLFISSQIAKAHGGRIDVQSDERRTTFTFSMPLSDEYDRD